MNSLAHRTSITADLIRGVAEVEATADGVLPHRLPAWARAQCPDPQLLMAESQPSGVRVVFRTESTTVELETRPTKREYVGAPPRPDGVYDVLVEGRLVAQGTVSGGNVLSIDMTTGSFESRPGPSGAVRLDGLPHGPKDVEIWLPHDETTELLELRSDAPVAPVDPAIETRRPVWLHHGSSISHGTGATSPTATWPAVAAALAGVELVNLGLGGGALLDPFTARVMRDTPADLISVKIGINVVNADLMRLRAFAPAVHGFLDTIREGHPATPLLVVSPVLCPIHEDTPGPSAPDEASYATGRLRFRAAGDPADVATGRLTLNVIRTELSRIVKQRSETDPHLSYLDGRELYGEADHAARALPDGLHPEAETHRIMGQRFARGWLEA